MFYEKMNYLIDQLEIDEQNLHLLEVWLLEDGIEHVYQIVHYMFDEDDHLKEM